MSRVRVRVICNDPKHPRKVAFIGWLEFFEVGDGTSRLAGGGERLIDNQPVPLAELFGTIRHAPTRPPEDLDRSRPRHVLQCRLCGVRAEMRHETATEIARELTGGGISKISLGALKRHYRL